MGVKLWRIIIIGLLLAVGHQVQFKTVGGDLRIGVFNIVIWVWFEVGYYFLFE